MVRFNCLTHSGIAGEAKCLVDRHAVPRWERLAFMAHRWRQYIASCTQDFNLLRCTTDGKRPLCQPSSPEVGSFPPRAFLFAPAFAIKPDRLQKPLQPPARLDGCALSIALGDPSGFRAESTGAGLIARMVVTLPLRSCAAWAGRRDRRHPYPGRHVKNLALPYERVWEVCAPSLSIYVGGRQCIRTCPAKAP